MELQRHINTCKQCGWQWMPHTKRKSSAVSVVCPKCRTYHWDVEIRLGRKRRKRGESYYKITKLRQGNPCFTLQQIGDRVGLTRQRVSQLLQKGGLPTKHYSVRYFCECGNEIGKDNKHGLCGDCIRKQASIPLVCDYCGGLFYRRKSLVLNRPVGYKGTGVFCSKKCQGHYLAERYGFKVHPENSRKGSRTLKNIFGANT